LRLVVDQARSYPVSLRLHSAEFRPLRLAQRQSVGVIGPVVSFNGGDMRRVRYFFLALVWLALSLSFVSRAHASDGMDCDHDTVESLYHCVQHAADMGHISNAGVANSLLVKVAAADDALARQRTNSAIRMLGAFINEVEAQAGIHVDAMHAEHMIMHAEVIIDGLLSP
jgi:hypothetical protein